MIFLLRVFRQVVDDGRNKKRKSGRDEGGGKLRMAGSGCRITRYRIYHPKYEYNVSTMLYPRRWKRVEFRNSLRITSSSSGYATYITSSLAGEDVNDG